MGLFDSLKLCKWFQLYFVHIIVTKRNLDDGDASAALSDDSVLRIRLIHTLDAFRAT